VKEKRTQTSFEEDCSGSRGGTGDQGLGLDTEICQSWDISQTHGGFSSDFRWRLGIHVEEEAWRQG
jgi:hypothetical protein